MTAEFMDTLFLGLLTYLAHSTVFLAMGLLITGFALLKNHALKEMILRFALFGALITTPLHMSGAFDPFFQPINIPEETVKSEPASFGLTEPLSSEVLPATTPIVTTIPEALTPEEAGTLALNEANKASSFTLANIALMLWALFGAAFLFQLGYLIVDLKVQLSGRRALKKGRATKIASTLANLAEIPTPSLSTKENLAGPFCLGTGEIVLPMWAEDLPGHQLKAMLAHEIAHIKRSDPSWILAARIVQSVFFFQPLNIFAARRLSELSEFACDAWAGKVCGSGVPLAECLAECAKRFLGRSPSALGAAMATKRSPIVERTQLLLAGIRDYSKPASMLSKVVVLSAFVIGGTMIPVFAFDEPAEQTQEEIKQAKEEKRQTNEKINLAKEKIRQAKEEATFAEWAALTLMEQAVRAVEAESLTEEAALAAEEQRTFREKEALAAQKAAKEAKEQSESFQIAMAENGTTAVSSGLASSSSSHIIEYRNGEWDIKVSYTDKNSTMKIRGLLSRFEVNDDETGFSFLDDGCYLDITATKDGVTRRVRFEESGGRVVETFWLNGSKTSKDQDMAEWVAKAIPAMFRITGLDAEGRTKRIFDTKGASGVLSEMELIPNGYTIRSYATALVKLDELSDEETNRFMRRAADISGSYDLRETLSAFVANQTLSKANWKAFIITATNISGSYDLRETLNAAVEHFSGPEENWKFLLEAAENIHGSYDLRETLTGFKETMPKDDAIISMLAKLAGKISSSYDLRQTLSAYAFEGGFGENGWLALLDVTEDISGSYDRRETLIIFAEKMPKTETLVSRYREIAGGIRSDNDREQAEEAIL